jgi:hypothetical protein
MGSVNMTTQENVTHTFSTGQDVTAFCSLGDS